MLENKDLGTYPTIDVEQFGRNLKKICEVRGVSAAELQRYLRLTSVQAVYLWFGGKRLPTVDNLYAISRYLGIGMDELIDGERQKTAYELQMNEALAEEEKRVLFYWCRLSQKA